MRRYLFLQGPVGPFFQELGKNLSSNGAEVWRINFNGGDCFFWQAANTINYHGKLEDFGPFVAKVAIDKKITDLVIYGDCRPVHKIALEVLARQNIKIHVFEEGYFRPDWITLEENGVNARSSLPTEPEFYAALPEKPFPKAKHFNPHFKSLIWFSTQYYIHGALKMYGEFKNYRHHFNISPHVTIARWVWKFFTRRHKPWIDNRKVQKILPTKFFLVPLQLCRDYQIKDHSQFADMTEFVDLILTDFARNAPEDVDLVFKIHPLDNDPAHLEKHVQRAAAKAEISPRVKCIDSGHLPTLVKHMQGMVVANSTSGIVALHHHMPLFALSPSVYNLPGLTAKGTLADFWVSPQKPDISLYLKFANYVIAQTQRNGNYYNAEGIGEAVKNSSDWLMREEPEVKMRRVANA